MWVTYFSRNAIAPLLFAFSCLAQDSIPDYVKDYAPIVYLDKNEVYFPSDLKTHLENTVPYRASEPIVAEDTTPDFSTLDVYSQTGCDIEDFGECPVFLTSKDNVSATPTPEWLLGVLPEEESGETKDATTSVIIVHDRGDGVVDAFYFYFYSFNEGNEVLGDHTGNHVGDWEHNMIRFEDGEPQALWYSQHEGGQTFTYEAVSKEDKRPIVYSSLGGHANYAVPGTQTREVFGVRINDTASRGPKWDPVLNAHYYTFEPSEPDTSGPSAVSINGTFTPAGPDTPPPDWLHFLGRWGDERYPEDDPRQRSLLGVSFKFESGPTGPLDKELDREEVCPEPADCTTLSELPAQSGSELPLTVTRTRTSAPEGEATATGEEGEGGGTETGSGAEATQTSGSEPLRGGLERKTALVAVAFALWVASGL